MKQLMLLCQQKGFMDQVFLLLHSAAINFLILFSRLLKITNLTLFRVSFFVSFFPFSSFFFFFIPIEETLNLKMIENENYDLFQNDNICV